MSSQVPTAPKAFVSDYERINAYCRDIYALREGDIPGFCPDTFRTVGDYLGGLDYRTCVANLAREDRFGFGCAVDFHQQSVITATWLKPEDRELAEAIGLGHVRLHNGADRPEDWYFEAFLYGSLFLFMDQDLSQPDDVLHGSGARSKSLMVLCARVTAFCAIQTLLLADAHGGATREWGAREWVRRRPRPKKKKAKSVKARRPK